MIPISTILKHYKRRDIQNAMVSHALDKEVAVKYGDGGFGKRPDILQHPSDVLELAKNGASSFHCSEELWENPLSLDTDMKKADVNRLRKGWDLILDIDCKVLDYSTIAADLLVKALKHFEIGCVCVKFSGNHGFHIGIPFEAFPEKVHSIYIKEQFPDGPKKIALFLAKMIKERLAEKLLGFDTIDIIAAKSGRSFSDIVKDGRFDPFEVLAIDTILIAPRHLYRMPYCLNEKSGLVSIPINPDRILEFDKASAIPEKVRVNEFVFLDRAKVCPGEAKNLIMQAFDANVEDLERSESEHKPTYTKSFEAPKIALAEDYFPPCIKKILAGLEDGKKRSLFILINFLTNVGWDYEKIGALLGEWNKRNKEELREVILKGQLNYHQKSNKRVLPPNCAAKQYYQDIHICIPDGLCSKIKNPVNYALIKARKRSEKF